MWEKSENNCKCSERCKPFVETKREREIESQSVESSTSTPVVVNFTKTMAKSNINSEAAAVTGVDEEGVKAGQCPFIVYGLTGIILEYLGKQHPH